MSKAAATNPEKGLVIHFHGGLVNAAAGLAIAEFLAPTLRAHRGLPLVRRLEVGLVETLKNNLKDMAEDFVFQELVKKVAEWALEQLGTSFTTKGGGLANINEHKLRADFDAHRRDGCRPLLRWPLGRRGD